MRHLSKSLTLAAVGISAWVTSELIYRLGVIPRLPERRHVPIVWWLACLLPILAAIVAAGIVSRTARAALTNGLWLAVPPVVLVTVYGAFTGLPIGHDMWIDSPDYWLRGIFQVSITVLAVVISAAVSRNVAIRMERSKR